MIKHWRIPMILFWLMVSGCTALFPQSLPTITPPLAHPLIPTISPSPVSPSPIPLASFTPLPSSTPDLISRIVSTQTSSSDNMVLVYIPAGNFIMGSSDSDSNSNPDEKPQHTVYLDAFWIDMTDITNAMYAKCVEAKSCKLPSNIFRRVYGQYFGNPQYGDFPVIYVTWEDAQTYCTWAGRRLPTEAEWEKAARGTDGRIYPWGNSKPTCSLANFGGLTDGCVSNPSKAGNYPQGASPYGALDMAGNVWQWVADLYGKDYYVNSASTNPRGPVSGSERVLRGGTWVFNESGIRSTIRYWLNPSISTMDAGFRCAKSEH